MLSANFYENWHWPYRDALQWMHEAREVCTTGGPTSIAVGSHSHPVITLGRHAGNDEIKDAAFLRQQGVEVIQVDRGGGATYHGPGQVVLYPVVNLDSLSIPDFTTLLEQVIIDALAEFDLHADRVANEPGVFIGGAKIGSIGLRVSQRIVTHGLSLNVGNDLEVYKHFVPCRKDNTRITSMKELLGHHVDASEVGKLLSRALQIVFLEAKR